MIGGIRLHLAAGHPLQLGQGAGDGAAVAAGAGRGEAVDLLAFQRRVDLQDRGRLVVLVRRSR